ncbi:hypothetical protein [Arthrobacter sp. StoSoilB5]|jgi:hypothetical protein|uniref:hypothetical protein n=1 Tax=Arthrobacter sp. StoSoilB5 TaxID=2830992 RepID=UPI001CC7FA7F|nr:hypothetical protein [Arthrobacter sp. StoSoilB5]BCW45377.1 hypothetical protein StoSoilB5_25610 [Arthrobacter sp. StoSoilB5]
MTIVLLLIILGFVAATSIAGGLTMALGSWLGPERLGLPAEIQLPAEYLEGSPFSTYLVPGILLACVVGGLHTAAFVLLLKRSRYASPAATTAAYSILVWIFVQMSVIPFSALQAVYFGAGLAELGLLLLLLGVIPPTGRQDPASRVAANGSRDGTLGPVRRKRAAVGSPHDRQEHSA